MSFFVVNVMWCSFIHQCSTHLLIRHYSVVVSWRVIIHIPISLTLIIAVSGWNQLDIGRLKKRGFKLNGFCIIRLESSDSTVAYCLELLVYVVSTSCAHCLLLFQFWFIVGSYQQSVQPPQIFIFPNSKWGANNNVSTGTTCEDCNLYDAYPW